MRDAGSSITANGKGVCSNSPPRPIPASSLVVLLVALVHGLGTPACRAADNKTLPAQVSEMREMILAAVRSGNADDLKPAIEWNAARPDLGLDAKDDPVSALKAASADGAGRETLAALGEILDLPPAALPLGKDLENNLIYVWPYLAERSQDTLSASEQIDLYRLVPHAKVVEMREKKRWMWWRLVIGADGTWHVFKKME